MLHKAPVRRVQQERKRKLDPPDVAFRADPGSAPKLIKKDTAFLYSVKSISTPKLADDAVVAGPAEEVLKPRNLKPPVGEVKGANSSGEGLKPFDRASLARTTARSRLSSSRRCPSGTCLPPHLDAIVRIAAVVAEFGDGEAIYEAGSDSDDLFVVSPRRGGSRGVEPPPDDKTLLSRVGRLAFGWTALGDKARRAVIARPLSRSHGPHPHCRAAVLTKIQPPAPQPESQARRHRRRGDPRNSLRGRRRTPRRVWRSSNRSSAYHCQARCHRSLDARIPSNPILMLLGFALLLGFWYLSVEVLRLPRFAEMPGPTAIVREWLSASPTYGISIYTPVYYQHILISLQRVAIAFAFATALGVPPGLLLGWSRSLPRLCLSGVRDAAADPDPRLGPPRDHDAPRLRDCPCCS